MARLLEITNETRGQIMAAAAVDNDELLAVYDVVVDVRNKRQEEAAEKARKRAGRFGRR